MITFAYQCHLQVQYGREYHINILHAAESMQAFSDYGTIVNNGASSIAHPHHRSDSATCLTLPQLFWRTRENTRGARTGGVGPFAEFSNQTLHLVDSALFWYFKVKECIARCRNKPNSSSTCGGKFLEIKCGSPTNNTGGLDIISLGPLSSNI